MLITKPCIMCNRIYKIEVPYKGYKEWQDGKHIQDAMPLVPAGDRELLLSGICDSCFSSVFGEDSQ